MRPHERHEEIVRLVMSLGEISVDDLSERLGLSKETVCRDLAHLDVTGRFHKFHGGGRTPAPAIIDPLAEGSFAARMSDNRDAKKAIARVATKLLSPGDSLFIDTGTTTLLFAEALTALSNLTIIANGTRIASVVSNGTDHKVFLVGGSFSADATETLGSLAVEQVQRFRAKYAFLMVGAVDRLGVYDYDERETQIAAAMIKQVEAVAVLADSSKYAKRGVFELAQWPKIARFISNEAPPQQMADAMEDADVERLIAV